MRLVGLSGFILIEAGKQQGPTADNNNMNVVFTWRLSFSSKNSGW